MSDKNSILEILPTGILVGDSRSPIPRIENLNDFSFGSTSVFAALIPFLRKRISPDLPASLNSLSQAGQESEDANMARPKKDTGLHKTRKIDFRLDETQYSIIENYAADAGMSVSDYVRHQAVYGKVEISYPVVAKVSDLQDLTSQFAAIGNNLNQIARYFNMGGLQSKAMREEINSCVAEIMKLRKRVLEMAGDFHGGAETPIE